MWTIPPVLLLIRMAILILIPVLLPIRMASLTIPLADLLNRQIRVTSSLSTPVETFNRPALTILT